MACIAHPGRVGDLKRALYLIIPAVQIEILYPRARAELLYALQGRE